MKLYVAGPMTGFTLDNFPAFDAARDMLMNLGHTVISPADLDRKRGYDPTDLPNSKIHPDTFKTDSPERKVFLDECTRLDFEAIFNSDGIFMLRGWERSTGAKAEHALALWMQKQIFYEATIFSFHGALEAEG